MTNKIGGYEVLEKGKGSIALYTLNNGNTLIHRAGVQAKDCEMHLRNRLDPWEIFVEGSCRTEAVSKVEVIANFVTESEFEIDSVQLPGRSRKVGVFLRCLRTGHIYEMKLDHKFENRSIGTRFGSFVKLFMPTGVAKLRFTFYHAGDHFGIKLC